MGWQVLNITREGFLSLKNNQCLYDIKDGESVSFPLDNLSVIIIETPYISITSSLLQALSLNNIVVFFCDNTHIPCGICYPYMQHFAYSKIFKAQNEWTLSFRKRLWQHIVYSKIENQSKVLGLCGSNMSDKLSAIGNAVDSGDISNREGFAAAIYWRELFGERFSRTDENIINASLNYGYAIVRGAIIRELAASGFIPCLGIHHDNDLNNFNLADDIIEPFRPVVDQLVISIHTRGTLNDSELTPSIKKDLIKVLFVEVLFDRERLSLLNAVSAMCKSLACASIKKDYRLLKVPHIC